MGVHKKYETVEELDEAIEAYFVSDAAYLDLGESKRVFAPTVAGLSRSLGMTRETLCQYGKEEGHSEFHASVKDAKARIGEHLEQRLYLPACAGVIFNLKNNYGYRDKQDIELSERPVVSRTRKRFDGSMDNTEDE